MFELRKPSSTILRSNYDTRKFVENRVPGTGFTNIGFKFCARSLYNILPKANRPLDNIKTFKKTLKTYIISETFGFETKIIRDYFAT